MSYTHPDVLPLTRRLRGDLSHKGRGKKDKNHLKVDTLAH